MADLATIPFASRSLTFDGQRFWSNHSAANETVAFSVSGWLHRWRDDYFERKRREGRERAF